MKFPAGRIGCIVVGVLVIVLVTGLGAWWYAGGMPLTGTPDSDVQVFLLTPASGDQAAAGDFVAVSIQASAPDGIASTELLIDGQSLGAGKGPVESASWSWRAWPAGVHVLTARAVGNDGQTGESQTVILNVMVLGDTIQVLPAPGETLAEVGEQFDVPHDQMAAANPHIDPSKPLADGQPVHVPGGGAGGPQPPPAQPPGRGIPFSIVWELEITKPVEQSYCYLSTGDGLWDKIPGPPFNYFQSLNNLYTQVFDAVPQRALSLEAECWGWIGGAIEYLGEANTTFDFDDARGQLAMNGQGFKFTGTPQWPGNMVPFADPLPPWPPFGLREPQDSADCLAHGGSAAVCGPSMESISEIVLEWEWGPGPNWPGSPGASIDSFLVFEQNASNLSWKLVKQVTPAVKAVALPLNWGVNCYAVRAMRVDAQYGALESEPATYCRGQPPATKQVVETPVAWLTSGGQWIELDCPLKVPFHSLDGQVAVTVGSWITDEDGGCFREGFYAGGVKFPVNPLPAGGLLQKATFKYSGLFTEYGSPFVASPLAPESCASELGTGNMDWTGLDDGTHYSKTQISGNGFYSSFVSLGQWMSTDVDVTSIVKAWLQSPETNHGFILLPAAAPYPSGGGTGKCLSDLGNFQLVIDFFGP